MVPTSDKLYSSIGPPPKNKRHSPCTLMGGIIGSTSLMPKKKNQSIYDLTSGYRLSLECDSSWPSMWMCMLLTKSASLKRHSPCGMKVSTKCSLTNASTPLGRSSNSSNIFLSILCKMLARKPYNANRAMLNCWLSDNLRKIFTTFTTGFSMAQLSMVN